MATEDYEYLDEFIAFAEELEPDLGPLFGRDAARIARALEACRAERERLLADVRAILGSAPHFVQDANGEVYSALQRLLALAATPTSPEPREGMVMVYDSAGAYLGCMGIERWQRLLEEDAPASPATEETP
jgi:hypothetical protein